MPCALRSQHPPNPPELHHEPPMVSPGDRFCHFLGGGEGGGGGGGGGRGASNHGAN